MTDLGFLSYYQDRAPWLIVAFVIFEVLMTVLDFSGRYLLQKKVGRPGHYVFIPFYRDYAFYDIAWYGRYGYFYVFFRYVFFCAASTSLYITENIYRTFFFVTAFIGWASLRIIYSNKLSKSFGKSLIYTYGLFFFKPVFVLLIALDKSEYLGRTLRRYNPPAQISEDRLTNTTRNRSHLLNFAVHRSIIALIAGSVVFTITFAAVADGIVDTINVGNGVETLFEMFTTNANTLSAIGAAFMIPYAIEGIRKKRFILPIWISLFQYSGAICTTLTMFFSLVFILPYDPVFALGGNNFFLHIICPIGALVLLFSTENHHKLTMSDGLICSVPFFIYAALYIFNVVLIPEESGGWEDIYLLKSLPISFVMPAMFMLALGVSTLIRVIHNLLLDMRNKRLYAGFEDYNDENEVLIEVYGLGIYYGKHDEINGINVPLDIFAKITGKYGIPLPKLSAAYTKGLEQGIKVRKERQTVFEEQISKFFGTPEKKRQDIPA